MLSMKCTCVVTYWKAGRCQSTYLKRKSVNEMISTSSMGILYFPQHVGQKDTSNYQTNISENTGRVTTIAAAQRALGQNQGPTSSTLMLRRVYKTGASFKKHINFLYRTKHA